MTKISLQLIAIKSGGLTSLLIQASIINAQPLTEHNFPNPSSPSIHTERVLPPPDQSKNNTQLSSQTGVWVNKIRLKGNTVFTDTELSKITKLYENREITTDKLHQLRRELTLYYINQGYISSGAIIPDQEVGSGEITLKIIEGKLSDIHIQDFQNLRLKTNYLTKRISLGNNGPLNLNQLQQRLQLLHQNPQIQKLQTELTPGATPGESILNVKATEPKRFQAGISINNGRSPSVGEFRLEAWLSDNNFT
jgi:hemolysin activation/secretion protein